MTKELLSDVLGRDDIKEVYVPAVDIYKVWYIIEGDTLHSYIEKNNLFFKMKEWAKELGYYIWSGYEHESVKTYSAIIYKDDGYATNDDFYANSEYDAVVLACEWILKD